MRITLTELYRFEPDAEASKLLADFREMLQWWMDKAGAFEGGSYQMFRTGFYPEWKKRWKGLNSQHAQTSSMTAYSALRLWRTARSEDAPPIAMPVAVLSPQTVKVEDEGLRISVGPREFAHVRLIPRDKREISLLRSAKVGVWEVGQVVLGAGWALVPFSREIDLSKEKDETLEGLLEYTL